MSSTSIPDGVTFFAPGTPAPQGSKVRTRYGMRESSQRVGPWRDAVEQAATEVMSRRYLFLPIRPPYKVRIVFLIKRPRVTKHRAPVAPTIGDLDKLARATHDALTDAGLIEDDRFIIRAEQVKRWARVDETPGAYIAVTETTL